VAAGGGRLRQDGNPVPEIKIGTADLELTTSPQGPLGQLIGGAHLVFPILQQFNTFAHAEMTITAAP